MKIGVRAHDIGKMDELALSQQVSAYGFDGVQLVFQKALGKGIDEIDLSSIKNAFGDTIMMLGAYFNMVHPDLEELNKGIRNFKKHIEIASALGIKYVGSETGSLMGSPWGYVSKNHLPETFDKVVDVVNELVSYAAKYGVTVALEGAWAHVVYSPYQVDQMIKTIDHPNLKVIIDLYNFLNLNNHQDHLEILETSLKHLKDNIVIFHLKDYIVQDEKLIQVGLGKGLMQYEKIIPLIQAYNPQAYLIFEGVSKEALESSLSFIKRLLKEQM